jgi:hypothetical protein
METRAIFPAMRCVNLICRFVGALSLTVVGFLLVTGTAAAHDGHVAKGDQPKASAQRTGSAGDVRHLRIADVLPLSELLVQAGGDDHESVPCSKGRSAGHVSGNCCTVACHGALAASPADPMGSLMMPGSHVVGLTGMLKGRSGHRTERPPKLG